jgi:hypothetical protein
MRTTETSDKITGLETGLPSRDLRIEKSVSQAIRHDV